MEEHNLATILKIVLDVGILFAAHLNNELIERIVVAAADGNGPPAIPALHLATQPNGLGESLELSALGVTLSY